MTDRDLVIEAVLPGDVNKFTYARNSHYVRFSKKDGQELKLVPEGMVKYSCSCQFTMLTISNHGRLPCPLCRGDMEPVWVKAQTCFVPESEQDFDWPAPASPPHKKEPDQD